MTFQVDTLKRSAPEARECWFESHRSTADEIARFSDEGTRDLPEDAIDPVHQKFLWATPGAWRHLGWRVHDEAAGRTRILPAEFFGPLPT